MAPKRKSDETTEARAPKAVKAPKVAKVDPLEGLTASSFFKTKELTFTGPDGATLVAKPCKFNTGTYGWKASGKVDILIQDGDKERSLPANISLNLAIPKSKKIGEAGGDDEEDGEEHDEDEEAEEEEPKSKNKAPAKKSKVSPVEEDEEEGELKSKKKAPAKKAKAVEEDEEEEDEGEKPKKKPASKKKAAK